MKSYSTAKSKRKSNLEVIIERSEDHFWGRIEDHGFMPTGQGKTVSKLLQNIKDSIDDYVSHEGKKDKFWSKVDLDNVEFNISFDVQAVFEEFNELKISSIAQRAELNPSLVRQYATGNKFPSSEQVKKIEVALHDLAKRLKEVAIYSK